MKNDFLGGKDYIIKNKNEKISKSDIYNNNKLAHSTSKKNKNENTNNNEVNMEEIDFTDLFQSQISSLDNSKKTIKPNKNNSNFKNNNFSKINIDKYKNKNYNINKFFFTIGNKKNNNKLLINNNNNNLIPNLNKNFNNKYKNESLKNLCHCFIDIFFNQQNEIDELNSEINKISNYLSNNFFNSKGQIIDQNNYNNSLTNFNNNNFNSNPISTVCTTIMKTKNDEIDYKINNIDNFTFQSQKTVNFFSNNKNNENNNVSFKKNSSNKIDKNNENDNINKVKNSSEKLKKETNSNNFDNLFINANSLNNNNNYKNQYFDKNSEIIYEQNDEYVSTNKKKSSIDNNNNNINEENNLMENINIKNIKDDDFDSFLDNLKKKKKSSIPNKNSNKENEKENNNKNQKKKSYEPKSNSKEKLIESDFMTGNQKVTYKLNEKTKKFIEEMEKDIEYFDDLDDSSKTKTKIKNIFNNNNAPVINKSLIDNKKNNIKSRYIPNEEIIDSDTSNEGLNIQNIRKKMFKPNYKLKKAQTKSKDEINNNEIIEDMQKNTNNNNNSNTQNFQ